MHQHSLTCEPTRPVFYLNHTLWGCFTLLHVGGMEKARGRRTSVHAEWITSLARCSHPLLSIVLIVYYALLQGSKPSPPPVTQSGRFITSLSEPVQWLLLSLPPPPPHACVFPTLSQRSTACTVRACVPPPFPNEILLVQWVRVPPPFPNEILLVQCLLMFPTLSQQSIACTMCAYVPHPFPTKYCMYNVCLCSPPFPNKVLHVQCVLMFPTLSQQSTACTMCAQRSTACTVRASIPLSAQNTNEVMLVQCNGHCPCDCPSTAVETAIAQCTSRWAMARGHRLNTSVVPAVSPAFFGRYPRSSLHSFVPPPPPPPFCGRKAKWSYSLYSRLFQWTWVVHV